MKKKIDIEILLIRLYILILILEGVIRYVLNLVNMASLVYVKDAILIIALILGSFKIKFNKCHLAIATIFCISFIVGYIYIGNIYQIGFFILKILIPFLVGLIEYKKILEDIQENKIFYEICFFICILGVFLNLFMTYPWEGLTYKLGDFTTSASASWTTMGQKRIGGFSRGSFFAATQIMIFAMIIQLNKKNGKIKKIICAILAITAIFMTTTKGMMVTSIIFYFITFFNFKFNKKILIKSLIIIMIFLPIFSTISDPIFEYLQRNLDYTIYVKYFVSFKDRLDNTWPKALELATEHGNIVLGRGMGGIGSSQSNYEPLLASPADNMFVYLYVTFGLSGLILFYYIIKKVNKLNFDDANENLIYNILLIICSYGIVVNIVEEPFLCILLGCSIGYMIKRNWKEIGKNENINSKYLLLSQSDRGNRK